MRAIKPWEMVEDLKAKKVGVNEYIFYSVLFVLGIVFSFPLSLFGWLGVPYDVSMPEWLVFIDMILAPVLALAFIPLAYYANKKGDKKDFWYRFISLEFPIGVQTGVVAIALEIIGQLAGIFDEQVYSYPDMALYLIIVAWAYVLTWKYMKRVAGA